MIRIGFIAIALSLSIMGCNGQTKDEKKTAGNTVSPQGTVRVNKEYDKNGNLIKYDSSYSYYYSNISKDRKLEDSLLTNFKSIFNDRYYFSDKPFFRDFFFEDSLLHYDFYKKDFFLNRYRSNMERMDSIFRGMDSIKNNYFFHQFPLRENEKEHKKKTK